MKENGVLELVFILDKSGSMSGLEKDTIGGYNSLLEREKEKGYGKIRVSTILFSNTIEEINFREDINNVKPLTEKEYYVGGCTAMLDAIGNTLNKINYEQHLLMCPDNYPDKTLVVITTDGMENASKEYSYSQVEKLIKGLEKTNFEFIFLGANIDASKEGARMGLKKENSISFKNDKAGIATNYEALGCAIEELKSGKSLSKDWHKKIDENNAKETRSKKPAVKKLGCLNK